MTLIDKLKGSSFQLRLVSKTCLLLMILGMIYLNANGQRSRPYDCGPVLKKKYIDTFERLNYYLDIKPGTVFAEVGASSGYYNGAMAVYLYSVSFYLQDIDK